MIVALSIGRSLAYWLPAFLLIALTMIVNDVGVQIVVQRPGCGHHANLSVRFGSDFVFVTIF